MNNDAPAAFCPTPVADNDDRILLGHGAGTRLTQQLLQGVFYPAFENTTLNAGTDSAVLPKVAGELAFTTDAYVVNPLFFAGGNIGSLAVCGTINDLAMVGAVPVALSASFVIEEGLPISLLKSVVTTMATIARTAGIHIVTGDTKVVEKGKADSLFVTTSGIGRCLWPHRLAPTSITPGDVIVLSGDLGRHAVAVLSARQGFITTPTVESDVACLHDVVHALHTEGVAPHCMRDLTRGGLGTALLELAEKSGLSCEIEETTLPLIPGVRSVVDALGLDPWFLANEGRFVAVVPAAASAAVVRIMNDCNVGKQARIIGQFNADTSAKVVVRSDYGTRRYLRMPLHEPLPRIC